MCVTYRNFYSLHSFRRGDESAKRLVRNASIVIKITLIFFESSLLGHGANGHSHSQRPMPRGFPLFKRCKWLVGNWTVSIWTSLNLFYFLIL